MSFYFDCSADNRDLHSFPTRRSSDLLSGIEYRYDRSLRGSDGIRRIVNDAIGQPISIDDVRIPSLPRSRSEEHTSELQSRFDLVCRLLLEKKNCMNRTILDNHTHVLK